VIGDLFELERRYTPLVPSAVLLGAFAAPCDEALLAVLQQIVERAPLRRKVTPGGHRMSVAMTNCGLERSITSDCRM
jgi:DNA oxidative demethylase